jgi:uncharacterized protein YbjT (DUF2867 family)
MAGRAPIIAVAGAGGDLGERIVKALVERGATVRALVRPDLAPNVRARVEAMGATIAVADPSLRESIGVDRHGLPLQREPDKARFCREIRAKYWYSRRKSDSFA